MAATRKRKTVTDVNTVVEELTDTPTAKSRKTRNKSVETDVKTSRTRVAVGVRVEHAEGVELNVSEVTDVVVVKRVKKAKIKAVECDLPESDLPGLRIKARKIYDKLMETYDNPPCPLDHQNHFQLLVAIILSAQSTDKKVNEITPALFKLAPDAASMAELEVATIEGLIKQIGLAPTKAKNISATAKAIVSKHEGGVPDNFADLEDLPGVGHKTASVLLSIAHKMATFPVDTHIHRLAQRWGLTKGKNVEQTEADLKALFPEQHWNDLHLRIIYFGREFCPAKAHDPSSCSICSWAAVPPYDRLGVSPLKAGQRPITSFLKG